VGNPEGKFVGAELGIIDGERVSPFEVGTGEGIAVGDVVGEKLSEQLILIGTIKSFDEYCRSQEVSNDGYGPLFSVDFTQIKESFSDLIDQKPPSLTTV